MRWLVFTLGLGALAAACGDANEQEAAAPVPGVLSVAPEGGSEHAPTFDVCIDGRPNPVTHLNVRNDGLRPLSVLIEATDSVAVEPRRVILAVGETAHVRVETLPVVHFGGDMLGAVEFVEEAAPRTVLRRLGVGAVVDERILEIGAPEIEDDVVRIPMTNPTGFPASITIEGTDSFQVVGSAVLPPRRPVAVPLRRRGSREPQTTLHIRGPHCSSAPLPELAPIVIPARY